MPSREERASSLNAQQVALRECTACSLSLKRTQVVFGVGDAAAEIMFVGEGPGFHEDKQGEPFVGQAGRLLSELLATIGLRREDVYIANVVKCRPPDNRDPLPDEIQACSPNLLEQVRTIRPRVICTLGRFATRLIGETEAPISSVRGRAKAMDVAGIPVLVFPLFHPAAALYTPSNRALLEEDLRKLRLLLDRAAKPSTHVESEVVAGVEVEPTLDEEDEATPQVETAPGDAAPGDAPVDGRAGGERARQLPLW